MIISNLQNFASTTTKRIVGQMGSTLKDCINIDQGLLTSVLDKRQYLQKAIDIGTSWTNIFSVLCDKMPDAENIVIDPNITINSDVSDQEQVILDGLQFLKDNYSSEYTMTDASGVLYNLHIVSNEWVEDGRNIQSLVKMGVANEVKNCIFYYEDGKLKFNQVLRSANFRTPSDTSNPTILGQVKLYCLQNNLDFDGSLNSIPGTGTIDDRLTALGATGNGFYERISSLVNSDNKYYGKVKLFWDVLRDYIQSIEINANLLELIKALSSGTAGIQNFMSSIAARINAAMNAIKKFWIDVSNAYAEGGFKGVIMFVYNFFRHASSMVDKDGCLSFTDNAILVPQQYIAGMVEKIVTTVWSLATMVITYISPIVGVIFGAVGALVYGVFKSISYDSSATRCAIQTSENVVIPAAPWAICQDEFTPSEDWKLILNENSVLALEVPGGFVIVGPGSYNDDKTINTVRAEFHPSVVEHLGRTDFDQIHLLDDCSLTISESAATGFWHGRMDVQIPISLHVAGLVSSMYRLKVKNHTIENDANSRLSDEDDQTLARIIGNNIFTFCVWMASLHVAEAIGPVVSGLVTVDGNTSSSGHQHWSDITISNMNSNNTLYRLLVATTPTKSTDYTFTGGGDGVIQYLSWSKFGSLISSNAASPYSGMMGEMVNGCRYYGDPTYMPSSFDWAVVPAKYDAATFLTWILVTTAITAVVAVATVVATFKIRKAIQNKRAEMNRSVDRAWDDYANGRISYDDYRKTVKKANRWQTVIGGTRYDYENYWNGDQSEEANNSEGSATPEGQSTTSSVCSDLISKIYTPADAVTTNQGEVSIEQIMSIIRGF